MLWVIVSMVVFLMVFSIHIPVPVIIFLRFWLDLGWEWTTSNLEEVYAR